jgi:hypothetical protein
MPMTTGADDHGCISPQHGPDSPYSHHASHDASTNNHRETTCLGWRTADSIIGGGPIDAESRAAPDRQLAPRGMR